MEKIGPYELIEEISRGGMAVVYRAHQPSVDRDVAIKVIMKHIAGDLQAVLRFQREARLIAHLEHPHILPVYDFDGGHEPPYIVMRYLEGGTLKEVMRRERLPLEEIGYLMQQVCSALDYAHRQGITHRDIKPSNIMIDCDGNAFVTDFGIARIVGGQGKHITETGAIVGTPDYMSPEQAGGITEIDGRADIYALGIILFEMLTGQLPYTAPTTVGLLMKHLQDPVPSALALNPGLPLAIDNVLKRALAKDPAARYTTANELALAIIEALGAVVTSIPIRLRTATSESLVVRQTSLGPGARLQRSDPTPTPSQQQKQVTALYANLAEFMELMEVEAADPQAVRHSLWQQLDRIIIEYGGVIDNHTGDTVLALWGAKAVGEDDPERAVRLALAILEIVMGMPLPDYLADQLEPLPVQIGIHTGITLLTRNDEEGTYSASGPTVNMATRLERAAPAGGILISPETYRQVRGVFLVEGLAPVRFRGSKDAVEVYLVKGVKPRIFHRIVPAVEGLETRLVGREAELKLLIEAMETAMEDEETQVVTIVGEAGLGKSRLLYELSEWEEKLEGDFWYFPTHITSQMVNQPFAMFRELFSFRFEIQDSDSPAVVQEKVERGVARFMGPGTTEQAHVVAHLLGFTFPDSPYLQHRDPQQLNSLAQKYLIDFFMAVARRTTAVAGTPVLGAWLQLENIHWADDRSLDFINHLAESRPRLPLVITCTARPSLYDRRPTWGSGQDFHQRLELRPLSRRDSRKLVKEILQKIEPLPDMLRDLVVERSEGNPFYMEELVKMLVEDRVILKGDERWLVEPERLAQVRVPGTLTGLLQARLDSLLPEERITMQRAAVIGRSFWDEAIKALQMADNIPVEVGRALEVLTRRELISVREETTFRGAREYIFKSTMLRDVTYDSIIKRQQRNYHAEVARWLEEVAGAWAGEYNLLIAEHYEIAGENVLAADYLYWTGEQAVAVGAYVEAIGFFERGLNLVKGQVDAAARRRQVTLHYRLGAIYIEQGQYSAGDQHLEASLNTAREISDPSLAAEALISLGQSTSKQGKFELAEPYLQEALSLARGAGDGAATASALMWLGATAGFRRQFQKSETYLLEALALAKETRVEALVARSLNILGENARYQDQYDKATSYYQEALAIYRILTNQFGIALVTINLGHVAAAAGEIKAASGHYLEALRLVMEIQAISFALETLAGLAGVKAAEGQAEYAVELLGLVLPHPAANQEMRLAAEPLLARLRTELPSDLVEAALARGQKLDLETVVRDLFSSDHRKSL